MSAYLDTLFGLNEKIVLITGGGTGIGRAAALGMAQAGARVAVVGRRLAVLEETVAEITENGGTALAVTMDVSDADAISAAIAAIESQLGVIDVVINNAGTESPRTLLQTDRDDWGRVMDINLVGPWQLAKDMVERWQAGNRGGTIINIASITGLAPQKGLAAYAVSKAALLHMTQIMALEWSQYGVRVNAIAPGYYRTDMTANFLDSESGMRLLKSVPMRRAGELSELVGAMIFLASDASTYVHGATLAVDGGHVIRSL